MSLRVVSTVAALLVVLVPAGVVWILATVDEDPTVPGRSPGHADQERADDGA